VSIHKHIRLFYAAFLFGWLSLAQSATLIFDLGEILLTKSSASVYWHIGLSKLLGFYNPFTIEKTVFKFLDTLEPRTEQTPLAMHNHFVLPQIMCDWLTGAKSNAEIRNLIEAGLKQKLHNNLFSTRSQKRIVRSVARFMFSPERFIKTLYPIKDGVKILQKCYHQYDEHGNRKHKIYILSNWDPESFELLVRTNKKVQKIISLCDGVLISGHAHLLKPDTAIFEYLFDTFNIDPDTELTVFIDDQQVNIDAARSMGKKNLHALHCKHQHFKSLKKKLKELEVI
jgi:FMN phosphatase YigB (HAD superfamily)